MFLDVLPNVVLLLHASAELFGRHWLVRLWEVTSGKQFLDTTIPDDVGEFEFVVRCSKKDLGLASPDPPAWAALPGLSRTDTTFRSPDGSVVVYPTPFDAVTGLPDGRTFCGVVGREVHIARVESR